MEIIKGDVVSKHFNTTNIEVTQLFSLFIQVIDKYQYFSLSLDTSRIFFLSIEAKKRGKFCEN
jgi:hypothetical protein